MTDRERLQFIARVASYAAHQFMSGVSYGSIGVPNMTTITYLASDALTDDELHKARDDWLQLHPDDGPALHVR
jgi:hypothetical protein